MAMLMAIMIPSADAQIAKYYPSAEVKAASNIPRFSLSGPVDRIDFNFTLEQLVDPAESQDYYISVGLFPLALMALGIVTLFFYNFFIMCRCCFTCLSCAPSEADINEHPEKVVKSRNRVVGFFFFFMIIVVATNHLLYLGT